jgi:hypothetical protein
VISYDIAALLSRFDVRTEGETALTGRLSSLLGESLLVSALVRYLSAVEGHGVLKPPASLPAASTADARRVLALWTPVSEDGRSCMSNVTAVRPGELVPVDVEAFSASTYLRDLRARGVTHLESDDAGTEGMLAALRAVVEVTGFSTAG